MERFIIFFIRLFDCIPSKPVTDRGYTSLPQTASGETAAMGSKTIAPSGKAGIRRGGIFLTGTKV